MTTTTQIKHIKMFYDLFIILNPSGYPQAQTTIMYNKHASVIHRLMNRNTNLLCITI